MVNRFGQPAERMVVNDQEQWLYNFDRSYISSPTKDVTQFSRPKKYLLFTLDAQGRVLKSESSRVDLSERKPAAGKTIALVAGAAIIVTLVIPALH
ncbi:MAG TPA: hypothetical protein VHE59_17920 [Mucilaginibacter sp.]|nr:hypothetical protein [Mucilaginibacter sp.]